LRRIINVLAATAVLLLMAMPSFANTATWSFTMNNRYVNGEDNGVLHTMSAGTMTFGGDVWNYAKAAGATGRNTIHLNVYRQGFPTDPLACSTSATAPATLGQKQAFSVGCGSEPADTYYVVAYKVEDDGWDSKGAGTLKTN
jgi:hypothetical protein